MPEQVRQLWFLGGGQVQLRDCPTPSPGPGEVLVRVTVSALCGSELPAYRGAKPMANAGHEAAGVVQVVGPECSTLAPGDRVGISAVQGCGRCGNCGAGRFTYCPSRSILAGMHADYVMTRELACHRLPADLPWEAAVLLTGDGLGVPYHVSRRLGDTEGASVAVLGVGPVGLGNVLVQAHLGAEVCAVDVSGFRLATAQALGAKQVVKVVGDLGHDELAERIVMQLGHEPAIVIECAGRETTLRAALAAIRPGGVVVCVGEQGPLSINPSADLIRRDVTLMGSWFYHQGEFPGMVDEYQAGLGVEQLVTHRFPLPEAAEAYQAFTSGSSGKILLYPDETDLHGRPDNPANLRREEPL